MRNKKWLPYLGLPILLTALILLKWGHLDGSVLLFRCALVVFGYLAALGDIREKRVPNRLVAAMLGAWVLLLTPQLFFRTQQAIDWALNGGLGLLLGGAVFLTVYLISRKGLGGGDVKLMAVSGLYLGLDGVLPAMLYGSVLAAVAGLLLILGKKITPKDAIPLVPFLYIGMLLTLLIR